jgi:putative hydrolase of the HAD superfamily
LNQIRAITIDLDDTLWEIHPVIHRAERRLRDWLGEHFPRVTELFSPEAALELRRQVALDHGDCSHDVTFLRRGVLARMAQAAGYPDALVDEAMEVFDRERNTIDLFPEVRPALEALRGRFVLIAVTNGNAKLERIGIDDLFDDCITAGRAGAAKPNRQIFEVAIRAGGAAAHETLHVGDHPEFDVLGARNAGMPTVWVNRRGGEWPDHLPRPDGVVEHVGQLEDVLAPSTA